MKRKHKFYLLLAVSLLQSMSFYNTEAASAEPTAPAIVSPTTPSFTVLAQKEHLTGSYGPGHPVTVRVLETAAYETKAMSAGPVSYGVSYTGHGEFSDCFEANAQRPGTHTLEIGFGYGYHVRRILETGKDVPFTLSLVEVSQKNIDGIKPVITGDKRVQLYQRIDGRKFLGNSKIAAESFDNIGLFHVMHFWTPSEILKALNGIHSKLKPGGLLTMSLSAVNVITSAEYEKYAATKPWGSVYAEPFLSESYRYSKGAETGQIVTYLPARALAKLLTAYGFKVLQAGDYNDFHPQNVHTTFTDSVVYAGVRAVKVAAPDPTLMQPWVDHAAICETIRTTDHSAVLSSDAAFALNKEHSIFQKARDSEENRRRIYLFQEYAQSYPAAASSLLEGSTSIRRGK